MQLILHNHLGFRVVGNFVAKFEVHHQLQQFRPHRGVLLFIPDGGEVISVEFPQILNHLGIVQHFVNRVCAPGEFESDQ